MNSETLFKQAEEKIYRLETKILEQNIFPDEYKLKKLGKYILILGLINDDVKYKSKRATYFILFNETKSDAFKNEKAIKYLVKKYLSPAFQLFMKEHKMHCDYLFSYGLFENPLIESVKKY
jgi:hypothetical protein